MLKYIFNSIWIPCIPIDNQDTFEQRQYFIRDKLLYGHKSTDFKLMIRILIVFYGGFSFCFNSDMFLEVLFEENISYLEGKHSPFPQKDFLRSEGNYWCLHLHTPNVLGGTSDVLHACWCWSSHWFLIWSSEVLYWTSSQIWGGLYLPMFLMRIGLLTLKNKESFIVLAKPSPPSPLC